MRYYFGSASLACIDDRKLPGGDCLDSKPVLSKDQLFLQKYEGLNPFERFARIIIDQLCVTFSLYDYNKNNVFEYD